MILFIIQKNPVILFVILPKPPPKTESTIPFHLPTVYPKKPYDFLTESKLTRFLASAGISILSLNYFKSCPLFCYI